MYVREESVADQTFIYFLERANEHNGSVVLGDKGIAFFVDHLYDCSVPLCSGKFCFPKVVED